MPVSLEDNFIGYILNVCLKLLQKYLILLFREVSMMEQSSDAFRFDLKHLVINTVSGQIVKCTLRL